jgi:mono/diheme cytochrome c family protein
MPCALARLGRRWDLALALTRRRRPALGRRSRKAASAALARISFVSLTLLVLAAAPAPARMPAQDQAPARAQASEQEQEQEKDPGRTAFARAGCEFCHGPGARGGAVGVALVPYTKALPDLLAIVREGIGTMPPMSADTVSDTDVAAIHAYLRKLSAPSAGGEAGAAISSARAAWRREWRGVRRKSQDHRGPADLSSTTWMRSPK